MNKESKGMNMGMNMSMGMGMGMGAARSLPRAARDLSPGSAQRTFRHFRGLSKSSRTVFARGISSRQRFSLGPTPTF